MITAIRRDSTGVAPLKDQGKLIQDPIEKATILNKQFQSVFSPTDTVQLPEMGNSPYSEIPNMTITTFGVIKLLENLNPHKAVGPDQLLPHTFDLIVLDFSKAFDKVSHKHLILKLNYYGINSTVIAWINSFLTPRTQSVTSEGFQSDHIAVTSGVPQGSVLGPILFLICINDLLNELKSSIRLVADDAIMYRHILSQTDCTVLQNDIHTLEKWEQKWIMTFNQAKCNTLSITRQRLPMDQSSVHPPRSITRYSQIC